jgi:hypothetical protein
VARSLHVDRSDRRYGDRVEGWVRPEYRNQAEEPRPGEYWTPIPVGLDDDPEPSAKGYGWPAPVERLPAVPSYQTATRFDLLPLSEPTEVVPAWRDGREDGKGRISLPRSWASRNEKPSRREKPAGPEPDGVAKGGAKGGVNYGADNSGKGSADDGGKGREKGGAEPEGGRRRPRPRPRPDAGVDRSTVYVSRHAAEPPR